MKKAIISGITGQDGSYLAEFLLDKGYEVHGLVRRTSSYSFPRIERLLNDKAFNRRIFLHEADLADGSCLNRIVEKVKPDEIYNLAAMSDVKVSFDVPEYTADVDGLGTLRFLEAIRSSCPHAKFYQASTSELFGKVQSIPQSEKTPFYPRSPYAAAKLYAYWIVVNYRESYNLFACNGILFNHESPRRGEGFVSRKITTGVSRIVHGLADKLTLGNLDAKRDWGYAKDFVEAMWLMLQTEVPQDFVIATGVTTTVREFVELSFKHVGIEIKWTGAGLQEKGIDAATGKLLVDVSEEYYRPAEVDLLIGDATKAHKILGWQAKTCLEDLVSLMMKSDLNLTKSLCQNLLVGAEA